MKLCSRLLRVTLIGVVLAGSSCRVTSLEELRAPFSVAGILPERLTLAVWNVQKAWSEDIPRDLERFARTEHPDLLLLQEAPEEFRTIDFLPGYFAGSWKYPWPGGRTIGVLTASPVRPISVIPLPSPGREFHVTAPKLCLTTTYPLAGGETLLVINAHLMAFERWRTASFRSQLVEIQETLEAHDGPAILAGDLNTWSRQRLEIVEQMAQEIDLEEVPFPPGRTTADRGSGFLNWILGPAPDLPLDRVYLRGLEADSVSLLPQGASDHVPLLLRLVRQRQTDPG